MAEWSNVLPLNARCLSPQTGFEYRLELVRKLPGTWRLGVGFRHAQLANQRATNHITLAKQSVGSILVV